ncbi:MAG: NAD(P)H-dependent oxidoreductase subunit E [Nitrospirae bacterium]|nr:NAD(P)H-dependent oxidoreductase subunit E [Nitrospirota bacterium]
MRGIERVLDKLKEIIKIDIGKTTEDRKFSLEVVRCLGKSSRFKMGNVASKVVKHSPCSVYVVKISE